MEYMITTDVKTGEHILNYKKTVHRYAQDELNIDGFSIPKIEKTIIYDYGEVYRSKDIFSIIGFKHLMKNGEIGLHNFEIKDKTVISSEKP